MRFFLLIVAISFTFVLSGCEQSISSKQSSNSVAVRAKTESSVDLLQPNLAVKISKPKFLSSPPSTYLKLHTTLRNPKLSKWNEAVEQLKTSGNQFTLSMIKGIQKEKLTQNQLKALEKLSSAIEKRHSPKSLDASNVQILLETAAYADLMCNILEGPLGSWTHKFIGVHADRADIRAELERIRDNYKSALGTETLFDAMDNRVPLYASRILERAAKQEK